MLQLVHLQLYNRVYKTTCIMHLNIESCNFVYDLFAVSWASRKRIGGVCRYTCLSNISSNDNDISFRIIYFTNYLIFADRVLQLAFDTLFSISLQSSNQYWILPIPFTIRFAAFAHASLFQNFKKPRDGFVVGGISKRINSQLISTCVLNFMITIIQTT